MCIGGVAVDRREWDSFCKVSWCWDSEGDVELDEFAGEWGFVALWMGWAAETGMDCWLAEVHDLRFSISGICYEI